MYPEGNFCLNGTMILLRQQLIPALLLLSCLVLSSSFATTWTVAKPGPSFPGLNSPLLLWNMTPKLRDKETENYCIPSQWIVLPRNLCDILVSPLLNWLSFCESPVALWLCCCSVPQLCLTLCNPRTAAHQASLSFTLSEFAHTHVHCVSDAIQPSHPLSPPSPPAFILSQHQCLFWWVSSSHQVAKVSEVQLQHQSLQWIFRNVFL